MSKAIRLGLGGCGSPHGEFNSSRGGLDYAMLEACINAVRSGGPAPIGLR